MSPPFSPALIERQIAFVLSFGTQADSPLTSLPFSSLSPSLSPPSHRSPPCLYLLGCYAGPPHQPTPNPPSPRSTPPNHSTSSQADPLLWLGHSPFHSSPLQQGRSLNSSQLSHRSSAAVVSRCNLRRRRAGSRDHSARAQAGPSFVRTVSSFSKVSNQPTGSPSSYSYGSQNVVTAQKLWELTDASGHSVLNWRRLVKENGLSVALM